MGIQSFTDKLFGRGEYADAKETAERLNGKKKLSRTQRNAKAKAEEIVSERRRFLQGVGVLAVVTAVGGGIGYSQKDGCKEEKKGEDNESQTEKEAVILDTTEPYVSKVFGEEGPIINIIGWSHRNRYSLKKARAELELVLSKNSLPVTTVLEGFESGENINQLQRFNHKLQGIIDFIKQKSTVYGGDDMKMQRKINTVVRYILDNGRNLSNKELCLGFYGIYKANRARTSTLLSNLKKYKDQNSGNIVIGMMGSDHFNPKDQDQLEEFARQNRMRIVLHVDKQTEELKQTGIWNERECGSIDEFEKVYRDTRRHLMRD